jgi:hypothetical protein
MAARQFLYSVSFCLAWLPYGGNWVAKADSVKVKFDHSRCEPLIAVQKRGQFFICANNETLPIAAMCVCNPDRSAASINH